MKTGRNEPCPCGSGKKYKHCCLAAATAAPEQPEDLTWRRLRRLLDEWQRDMLRFVTNVYGPDAIEEAWHEFLLDDETPFDPESIHLQVFMSWLYHFWSPDSIETKVRDKALHDAIPTAEYLRKKRHLDPLLRQYLESCLAAPMSVFDVLRVDPGRGMSLRDILTGADHEVTERSASISMDEGDLIFGQVAQAGGMALLETCQGFVVPPIWKVEVLNFRQRQFQGGTTVAPQTLRDCDLEVLGLYHAIARRVLEPKLPALQNTDGEALSLRKVVYDVPSAQEAFDALKHLALDDNDDDLLHDAGRDAQGGLASVQFSWLKRGNQRNPGWENTVLGSIQIDGTRLTAEVNSKEREKELRAIVGKAFGERARYRATRIQSAEKLLSQAPAAAVRANEAASLAELPEAKAKIAEMMAKHYEHWVKEKIPALGGRTPLEAVADPAGREAVEALVRQIERDGERMAPPLDPSIVRSLRERLRLG
ncbi:MAG: SEC-C domain-containing protein [Betaproteobacteria bacterium]|nr:SEC-C domain-containing protein [Betaproteobacteria bacterium]